MAYARYLSREAGRLVGAGSAADAMELSESSTKTASEVIKERIMYYEVHRGRGGVDSGGIFPQHDSKPLRDDLRALKLAPPRISIHALKQSFLKRDRDDLGTLPDLW